MMAPNDGRQSLLVRPSPLGPPTSGPQRTQTATHRDRQDATERRDAAEPEDTHGPSARRRRHAAPHTPTSPTHFLGHSARREASDSEIGLVATGVRHLPGFALVLLQLYGLV